MTKRIDNILRMFTARFTIKWDKPDLGKAVGEFFGDPEASGVFAKHDLIFLEDRELTRFLAQGKLRPLDDDILSKVENFFSNTQDLNEKLRDQTYSQAYAEMERKIEQGDLFLDAPIVIKFNDGTFWGLCGKRRAYVARKHGIPVQYYVVEQEDKIDKVKENEKDDKKEESEQSEMATEFFAG